MAAAVTVGVSDRVVKALALMAAAGVARACVVSADETLVGMLDRDRALAWLEDAARLEIERGE
jgi:CBS domain-containing protein